MKKKKKKKSQFVIGRKFIKTSSPPISKLVDLDIKIKLFIVMKTNNKTHLQNFVLIFEILAFFPLGQLGNTINH